MSIIYAQDPALAIYSDSSVRTSLQSQVRTAQMVLCQVHTCLRAVQLLPPLLAVDSAVEGRAGGLRCAPICCCCMPTLAA